MGVFGRAAVVGCSVKSRCDYHIHDEHHHCSHSTQGEVIEGSPNVFFNGAAAYRLGDKCLFTSCQHSSGEGKAIESSNTVFINGKGSVRIKDNVQCADPICSRIGTVTQGCQSIYVGD